MATLYVENVPDDLYEAVRRAAKQRRSSIAAEVISVLQANFPTQEQLQKRRELYEYAKRMHKRVSPRNKFPSTEEMIREDRDR
jgi:plasmid stability protein